MKKSLIVIGIITLLISNVFANDLQKNIIGEWQSSSKDTTYGITFIFNWEIEYCQDNTSNTLVTFEVIIPDKNNKLVPIVAYNGIVLSKWNIKENIFTEEIVKTRFVKSKEISKKLPSSKIITNEELPQYLKIIDGMLAKKGIKNKFKIISMNNKKMVTESNGEKFTFTRK